MRREGFLLIRSIRTHNVVMVRLRHDQHTAILFIRRIDRCPRSDAIAWLYFQVEIILMQRLSSGAWGLVVEHTLCCKRFFLVEVP
ncbi:hypothetical protein D3C78_1653950 [compost metagenome]